MKQVIIVGGGIAGLSCAQKLARRSDVHVTLLDKVDYYEFKSVLYQVATSELGVNDIATRLQTIFQNKSNVDVKLAEVTSINPSARTVFTADGKSFTGDIIVLAVGSQPNFYGVPGAAEYSYPLYTLDEAYSIRQQILNAFETADKDPASIEQGILNFVVVGAGPTGTEFAGSLSDIILKAFPKTFSLASIQKSGVYLVDFLPTVLAPFTKGIQEYAEQEMTRRHVHLCLNRAVKQIFPDHILLADGSIIKTETVIWAGGVRAAPLVERTGLPLGKGGRVEVEKDFFVKGFPGIYAIGDCANMRAEDGSFLPQLGTVAKQCGALAAANILRTIDGKQTSPFHYYDKGKMAIIGDKCAVANIGKRRIELKGILASMAWCLVHSSFLPTFRQRIKTLFRWFWGYFF